MRQIRPGVWEDEPMGKRSLTRNGFETDVRAILSKHFSGLQQVATEPYRARLTPAAREIADLVERLGLQLAPERNNEAEARQPEETK